MNINSRRKIEIKYHSGNEYESGYFTYVLYIKCWYKCFNTVKSTWVKAEEVFFEPCKDFKYHQDKLMVIYHRNQNKKRNIKRLLMFK